MRMWLYKSIKRRNNMLSVTEIAKEKLGEHLQTKTTDPEMAVRLITSPSEPNRFALVLDKEKKGDQVVEDKAGINVMLIGPDLASDLAGWVVDYKETPESAGFTIFTPDPGT
jgi:Fe-S cluster assembly iron-binding protein IscA